MRRCPEARVRTGLVLLRSHNRTGQEFAVGIQAGFRISRVALQGERSKLAIRVPVRCPTQKASHGCDLTEIFRFSARIPNR